MEKKQPVKAKRGDKEKVLYGRLEFQTTNAR
jgi:hypothetical protein